MYNFQSKIGKKHGVVYKAIEWKNGKERAIKAIRKSKIKSLETFKN